MHPSLNYHILFFRQYPSLKLHIVSYSNSPAALWHIFPDITHINVNNVPKLAILNLIFQGITLPETTYFVCILNGQAIWLGLLDKKHIKVHFEFGRLKIFQELTLPETAHFVVW